MRFILLLLPIFLLSNENNETESFLSDIEYGEMLYNNPRGIPCSKCHGEKGKGGHKIAKYYDKDSNPRILKGDNITKYTLKELEASLENRFKNKKNRIVRHRIMPKYYLTSDEIRAIYLYLKSVKKK